MACNKPWKSYQDQLDQLIQRGLIVSDTDKALNYLERIGYYRLSGYWYPFREIVNSQSVSDNFKSGATFKNSVDLYVFDKKLRLLVMDALERIEIALRVDISHSLGKKDPFSHINPNYLSNNFSRINSRSGLSWHQEWVNKHDALINRSKEKFIDHYKAKHGLPLPIWVACEVWDFGTLSTLFSGMTPADKNSIAKKYGVSNGKVFQSWLRSLNYLRNVCAHHSRLWNRNIIDQPKLPKIGEVTWVDHFQGDSHLLARPFLLLCIAKHLLNIINPSSTWGQRLKDLLSEFPDLQHLGLNLAGMGVVADWEKLEW